MYFFLLFFAKMYFCGDAMSSMKWEISIHPSEYKLRDERRINRIPMLFLRLS